MPHSRRSEQKQPIRRQHPVDVHVGRRLREARLNLQVSQSALATHIGLSFQQIQKYEAGTNRISASVLWVCCEFLKVTPNWFFDGVAGVTINKISPEEEEMSNSTQSAEFSQFADDLTSEERSAVLAVVGWMRSKPKMAI